jgi:hypothetical protein
VPSEVAAVTRTIAYERAGIGASEPRQEPRAIKQIVEMQALRYPRTAGFGDVQETGC